MSERLLVRGELSGWVHFGRVAGLLAAVIGAGLELAQIAETPLGWILCGCGVAIWLTLEFVALKARLQRTYLTIQPDGFLVEDRSGQRVLRDEQATAVAFETKRNLSNGELSSTTRTFTVWAADRPEPVIMQNTLKVGVSDPLVEFINRLIGQLQTRFDADIDRGGSAVGEGWTLTRMGLSLGKQPYEEQIPLPEITAVEIFDGKMCIWRRGKDEAVAKLPLSGRNVFLLPHLVQPRLPERTDTGGGESASGLGRVLFERSSSQVLTLGMIFLGGFFGLLGAPICLLMDEKDSFILGLCMGLGGLALLLGGIALRFSSFRCHERGVVKKNLFGEKTLRYADVGSFTYGATRHYHNGAYTGTHLNLSFKPAEGVQASAISYFTTVQGQDDDLDELRDFISRAIAARMIERLQSNQPVVWTPNLEIHPSGIRYRPAGFFGKKEPIFLPFAQYGGHNLHEGHFHLFEQGKPKSVFNEPCSAENFFPGYFLLVMLEQSGNEAEAGQ